MQGSILVRQVLQAGDAFDGASAGRSSRGPSAGLGRPMTPEAAGKSRLSGT